MRPERSFQRQIQLLMEHTHLSYKTRNTIQIRIALSQIRNAITTGFRLWSAVKKRSWLVMQVCWRKPKISIWTQWRAVIFRAGFIYRLLWGLYVMQTYISLLILLLVNHALQVLNNNGADHLWHLAVGDGSFVLWSDFTRTTSKAELSLSRKGLKDDFTDFSSKIVY